MVQLSIGLVVSFISLSVGCAAALYRSWWIEAASSSPDSSEERGCASERSVRQEVEHHGSLELDEVRKVVSFPVCTELEAVPLELGCGHTFGLSCVDKLYSMEALESTVVGLLVSCPMCRYEVAWPFHELRTNIVAQGMMATTMRHSGNEAQHSSRSEEAGCLVAERRDYGYLRAVRRASSVPLPFIGPR